MSSRYQKREQTRTRPRAPAPENRGWHSSMQLPIPAPQIVPVAPHGGVQGSHSLGVRDSFCPGTLKKLSPDQVAAAVAKYERGASVADCAIDCGISRQGMWDLLRRRTTMRPRIRVGEANHFFRGGSKARRLAHRIVEKAIARGTLKVGSCETCGQSYLFKDGRRAVQAHHDDYSKPLEVRWLCQRCHHAHHRKGASS